MDDRHVGPIVLQDRGGHQIRFFNYKGTLLPTFPGDLGNRIKALENFKARKDDVVICSYPKSGSSWVWEIIHMLLHNTTEHITGNKMATMLEVMDQSIIDQQPSPRCLSFHFSFDYIPKDFFEKGSKIVYLLRNPKDVCVSHFHHHYGLVQTYGYHGNWTDYFPMWLEGNVDYGSWFPYVREWENGMKKHPDYNIHLIYYEDLKTNFTDEIKKLASFLGLFRSSEYFDRITEQCEFSAMKAAKEIKGFSPPEEAQWRNGKAQFLRKGTIGDWKNHFTLHQNEVFDNLYDDKMKGSQLKFKFEI